MSDGVREILFVEDNLADVRLTREAFKGTEIQQSLRVVRDGVEAMEYLRGEAGFAGAAKPAMIILDLNLPRKNGREVLMEIKNDPDLKLIPVVVLSTSGAECDVNDCYRLQANAYVQKPSDFDRFEKVVQGIENFWLTMASLPQS